MQRLYERSYQIVTKGGRPITRNQRDLKPYPGNVEVKFKSNPPSNPLTSSSPDVCNIPKPMTNKIPEGNKVSTEKPVSAKTNKSPRI